jgi:hypothetical protein
MTHGDKAKGKKTASKASGSKKSSKAGKDAKSSKTAKAGKEGGGKKAVQASTKAVEASTKAVQAPKKQQASPPKAVAAAKGSNGKLAPRGASGEGGFSNPVIANAFKRAIKKFPNAFRKLTD